MTISAEVFNEEFPLDRREILFSSASRDMSDNTVACYRYISGEIHHILSEEVWDTSIINPGVYDCVEFAKSYIKDFLSDDQFRKFSGLFLLDTSDSDIILILKEIFIEEFGADEDQVLDILGSYEKLMKFILSSIPKGEVIHKHRGNPTIFSPYMSWSIAGFSGYFSGMIGNRFKSNQSVYIEAIIPDDELTYDDRQSGGEKEVLTTQVKKEWITRVFTYRQQMIREIFSKEFEYCNIGLKTYTEAKQYAIESESNPFPLKKENINYSDIAEHWRFNTDTKLYLPKDFKIISY